MSDGVVRWGRRPDPRAGGRGPRNCPQGICALLGTEREIEVVGEAKEGQEAVSKTLRLCPEVVLMDLVMPGMDGLELSAASWPRSRSAHPGADELCRGRQGLFGHPAGALGYLLKDSAPRTWCRRSSRCTGGSRRCIHDCAQAAAGAFARIGAGCQGGGADRTGARGAAAGGQGHSNDEMARLLAISEATVRTHVSNILAKLGGEPDAGSLYALREGLATL